MHGVKYCSSLPRHVIFSLDKSVDFATVNLKKLKVRDLRKILQNWGEECRGCTEKSDYMELIEKLIAKYEPEAAKKRSQKDDL